MRLFGSYLAHLELLIVILELQLVTMFFTERLLCSSPVHLLLETSCSAPTWKAAWRALQAWVKTLVSLRVHFPPAQKLIKSFKFNSKKFGVKPVGNVKARFSPQSQMLGIFPAVIDSKTTKRCDEACCQEKHTSIQDQGQRHLSKAWHTMTEVLGVGFIEKELQFAWNIKHTKLRLTKWREAEPCKGKWCC